MYGYAEGVRIKGSSLKVDFPMVSLASEQLRDGQDVLGSAVKEIDHFLSGAVRIGDLSEWGMPLGQGGRELILNYLAGYDAKNHEKHWSLWICGKADINFYPPAWMARGVDLAHTRFAYSVDPLRDLKPVFMESIFRVIVIDMPTRLTHEQCAFLSQRARINKQAIFILRDFFLTPKRGNVWAKLRVNCWRDEDGRNFHLRAVRGLATRHLSLRSNIILDRRYS